MLNFDIILLNIPEEWRHMLFRDMPDDTIIWSAHLILSTHNSVNGHLLFTGFHRTRHKGSGHSGNCSRF